MEKLMGNSLILLGIVILVVGLVLTFMPKGGIPRLPGDIYIQREGFTFYFPIVSSIILSVVLALLFSLFRR